MPTPATTSSRCTAWLLMAGAARGAGGASARTAGVSEPSGPGAGRPDQPRLGHSDPARCRGRPAGAALVSAAEGGYACVGGCGAGAVCEERGVVSGGAAWEEQGALG